MGILKPMEKGVVKLRKRLICTLQVIYFSVFPAAEGGGGGDPAHCQPQDVSRMDRFLDSQGEFRVFFPDCMSLAAPLMLFRLKRQGYSGCFVESSPEGLYLQGRR